MRADKVRVGVTPVGQESRAGIKVAALVTMRRNSETSRAVSELGKLRCSPSKRERQTEEKNMSDYKHFYN